MPQAGDDAPVTSYTYLPDIAALVSDPAPDSIISRTVFKDAHVKVVLFGFAAGQELSEHTSSQPAILHILKGEARLGLGNETVEAQAGAWVFMPPRLRHSVLAKTPVVMLLSMLKKA